MDLRHMTAKGLGLLELFEADSAEVSFRVAAQVF